MKYAFLLITLITLITSCTYPRTDIECDDINFVRSNVDRDGILTIINSYAVNLEELRKHRLVFEDSTIFYNEQHLEKIWVKFITQDLVDLWEARKLLTQIVDGYLEAFNSDPLLFASLLDGEITADQIDVTVVFESFFGKYVDPLYVGSINMQNGKVFYYAFDAFDISTDYWHQRVESYHKTSLLNEVRTTAQGPFWEKHQGKREKSSLNLILEPAPQKTGDVQVKSTTTNYR